MSEHFSRRVDVHFAYLLLSHFRRAAFSTSASLYNLYLFPFEYRSKRHSCLLCGQKASSCSCACETYHVHSFLRIMKYAFHCFEVQFFDLCPCSYLCSVCPFHSKFSNNGIVERAMFSYLFLAEFLVDVFFIPCQNYSDSGKARIKCLSNTTDLACTIIVCVGVHAFEYQRSQTRCKYCVGPHYILIDIPISRKNGVFHLIRLQLSKYIDACFVYRCVSSTMSSLLNAKN